MKNTSPFLLLCTMLFSFQLIGQQTPVGNKEQRAALFDYIILKTEEREAFSMFKNSDLDFDPVESMKALRQEFVDADTNDKLWFALKKLNAARHDRHLKIKVVDNGISEPSIEKGNAAIRFYPDFSDPKNPFLFVSDLGESVGPIQKGNTPNIGDKLLKVNGVPVEDYLHNIAEYTRFSTWNNFLMRAGHDLGEKGPQLPATFFRETLDLVLQTEKGRDYSISLPYQKEINWQVGRNIRDYPGYQLAWKAESFWVYAPIDKNNKTILLWWYGFRKDLIASSDKLVDFAEEKGMLDHNIIIDATNSRGGSLGAAALARLSPHAFKTTGGNLKLSDITYDFISDYTEGYLDEIAKIDGSGPESEDDSRVVEWLNGPVLKGLKAGQSYSNNVPFKCAHLPHYSDWMMQPAEKHFSGNLVFLVGPWGGSHLDQFSAMIYDNDIGHSIGMPSGGYSNTWEWTETLFFPETEQPVISFMWNIGHTIRPNGEILEGNPAPVDEFFPVTRSNYLNYKGILVEKAQRYLKSIK